MAHKVTLHDYLWQAPQERVPFPRHKRRPGKQSQLTQPRLSDRATRDYANTVKITRADGTVTYGMGRNKVAKAAKVHEASCKCARCCREYADMIHNERAASKAAMLARVSENLSSDHWSR